VIGTARATRPSMSRVPATSSARRASLKAGRLRPSQDHTAQNPPVPEAERSGGAITGASTLLGFLAAIFFKTFE